MGCGIACVKYLLFIFNFIFALCGLALLVVGVLILQKDYQQFTDKVEAPVWTLIIVGSIVFVIAFFGCCGAIRESHCMVLTFAIFLLTILVIQIVIGVYTFIMIKNLDSTEIDKAYTKVLYKYWDDSTQRKNIDTVQSSLECCGATSYSDYNNGSTVINNANGTIPLSCCSGNVDTSCLATTAYDLGCVDAVYKALQDYGKLIGGVALGIAGVELVGIIFALCLANSIRNADRRGYRV